MLDPKQLSEILVEFSNQNFYLKFEPEIFDFTDPTIEKYLVFCFKDKEMKIFLSDENLPFLLSILKLTLFGKENRVLTWDWKNLSTYVLAKTGRTLQIDAALIDLKILESYSGFKKTAPETMPEALNRLKEIVGSGSWKESESIYKKIHLPLMTEVIPHLETVGVLDAENRKKIFAHYEIEGQQNGRLRCHQAFKDGFVPHAMTPQLKQNLKPKDFDKFFVSFDFQGMEVFVLAWLSQDMELLELCGHPDVYSSIFEKISNKKCGSKNQRDLAKKFFLPVIYGQSANSLSQNCGLSLTTAEAIVGRIKQFFPAVSAFIQGYQRQIEEQGYAKDHFGRRRLSFEEGKSYAVRNFAVQSPAALICLEKLISLYFEITKKTEMVYTVHDGYVVYADKSEIMSIAKTGLEVLSAESFLCPDLKLRVSCQVGENLNELKPIEMK